MLLATPSPHPPLLLQTIKTNKELSNLSMAAENSIMSLIGVMDRLWFHHIILFPQPPLFHPTKIPVFSSEYSLKSSQESEDLDKNRVKTEHDDLDKNRAKTEHNDLDKNRAKTEHDHSHSSSPFSSRKKLRLVKSMSCKTLIELELEAVRGFIDLGFNFRRENLSNHIINLIPGLQRFGDEFEEINDEDHEEEEKYVMRPYLSESWIIRRPDSPLLNLRMPTFFCVEDMKKHLKFWAQTVALAVQE